MVTDSSGYRIGPKIKEMSLSVYYAVFPLRTLKQHEWNYYESVDFSLCLKVTTEVPIKEYLDGDNTWLTRSEWNFTIQCENKNCWLTY